MTQYIVVGVKIERAVKTRPICCVITGPTTPRRTVKY